jgi:DNA-directed RNA polymerase specialized sigma24 family protein
MSPLPLRRYRAERLLREQFERLRRSVIGGVASRLRAVGVQLDEGDLEAAYGQAWQGLYASVLDGAEVVNPEAWLALVTYRRALDEHRARVRVKRVPVDPAGDSSAAALAAAARTAERDLADELDDRVRLRHLFEGLRARLSEREQQAATLCYLQGLSRAEAATRMGVSETRMRKLMEGRGDGVPGVARKLGTLVETIGAGRWCEEQGSLMRGFAFGVLDPAGERYELAELHHSECSACRAYVLSLRGIAAVLPPIPSLLAPLLGSSAVGALAASSSVGGGGAAGSATSAGGVAPAGSAAGASALSASSAVGASAAGGGWWLAGPLGAKLAAGCLITLGVGAGCAALGGSSGGLSATGHRHKHSSAVAQAAEPERASDGTASAVASGSLARESSAVGAAQAPRSSVAPSAQAAREFGPEQTARASVSAWSSASASSRTTARTASSNHSSGDEAGDASAASSGSSGDPVSARAASSGVPAAQREFAPG